MRIRDEQPVDRPAIRDVVTAAFGRTIEADLVDRLRADADQASGFSSPYAGPHLMVLELGGALPEITGEIAYAPAFAGLD